MSSGAADASIALLQHGGVALLLAAEIGVPHAPGGGASGAGGVVDARAAQVLVDELGDGGIDDRAAGLFGGMAAYRRPRFKSELVRLCQTQSAGQGAVHLDLFADEGAGGGGGQHARAAAQAPGGGGPGVVLRQAGQQVSP